MIAVTFLFSGGLFFQWSLLLQDLLQAFGLHEGYKYSSQKCFSSFCIHDISSHLVWIWNLYLCYYQLFLPVILRKLILADSK